MQDKKKIKKYTLILISLILIIILLSIIINKSLIIPNVSSHSFTNHGICTRQGNNVVINIYNKIGQLKFKLTAHCIQYFSDQQITWFIYPNVTAFDEKNIPTWKITANQAKLSYEKILHLYEYVYVTNLKNNACFQSIETNQATINLITQDFISNEKVIIHGHCFYSIGMKMDANLHTQTAKLIDNTQIYYDIQHAW
ncbi:LPS export ABC transporter periplasmic protein LptC [Blochmannia endosymbiont of Camponotus nipponensis]|uniref:LPS export ABC transporter periplasmic protein LptC n=1 Tax=Blochmannia endosymbiont of Camponotus nipponensis TaxID=2681986 RepID=UPI00135C36BC|nr:LPS export ABC transporter periplasmic protein LptC [Blochmannia endosymbiont of Camponotus nipponensis]